MSDNTNSVDVLTFKITGDASDAYRVLAETKEKAMEQLEEISVAWSSMGKDAQEAGMAWRNAVQQFGDDTEGARVLLEKLAEQFGFTKNEMIAFASVAERELNQRVAQAIQNVIAEGEKLGRTLGTEQRAELEAIFQIATMGAKNLEEGLQAVDAVSAEIMEGMKRIGPVVRDDVNEPLTQTDRILNEITGAVGNFFRQFAIGALALKGIQGVWNFIREGYQLALESEKALTRFEMQVRQLQRTMGADAGTIKEWRDGLKEIARAFGEPLPSVMGEATLLIQRMGGATKLSKEQMLDLVEAATALNIKNGQVAGSARALADFIERGQIRALQQLGIEYTESLFKTTALELGINKTKNEMTLAEQQLVRYTIVMKQMGGVTEDAAAAQDTLAARVASAKEDWIAAEAIIGRIFALAGDVFTRFAGGFKQVATTIVRLLQFFGAFFGFQLALIEAGVAAWNVFWDAVKNGEAPAGAALEAFATTFETSMTNINNSVRDRADSIINGFEGMGDIAEDELGSLSFVLDETAIAAEEAAQRFEKAFDRMSDAIVKAANDWDEGLRKAQQSLADKMEDIALDLALKREDINRDLVRDLSDMERDYNHDRAEKIQTAQEKELKLREDYARAIKDLENKYLLDLEDALRERDARRILELLRRMNEEKKKRERDYKQQRKEQQQNLKDELADLDRALAQKRQARMTSYKRELEDADRAASRKIYDARLNYMRELRDLQASIQNRLRMVADGLARELQLNAQQLAALYSMLNGAYGGGGWVEQFFLRYLQMLAAMSAASAVPIGGSYIPETQPRRLALSRGAIDMVATSPTLLMVGERPEIVNVSPLGGNGRPLAGFNGSGRTGGGGGRTAIEINLGDGLVGRIVDNALDEMADVVITMNQGGA